MQTFPALPDIQSPEPWRLQSIQDASVDLYVDVPGTPQSTRPEEARWAQGACGGPLTLLTMAGAALEPLQFRIQLRLNYGPNRNARRAALEAAWLARGPYLLTAPASVIPDGSIVVLCDPSQGGLEYLPDGGAILLTMGFKQAQTGTPGAPVASTALVTWEALAAVTGGATTTVRVTWEYAGDDLTAQDALYLYQPGTTSLDIQAAAFDPDGTWFPVVATNGQVTGSVVVDVPNDRLGAFSTWLLGYYQYDRGLIPVPASVVVTTAGGPAVQIFWLWLAPTGAQATYPAAVTWNYLGPDPQSGDSLYLFQEGTTTPQILAHSTDPVSGRWFPLGPTHGAASGQMPVDIDAAAFNAHTDWHVGYFHVSHGLLDSGIVVPDSAPAPQVGVTLTWAWAPDTAATGQVTWAYAWADQSPSDWLVVIQDDTLAADVGAIVDAMMSGGATGDPTFQIIPFYLVGRAGQTGAVLAGLENVAPSMGPWTHRQVAYYSPAHGLLGRLAIPAPP